MNDPGEMPRWSDVGWKGRIGLVLFYIVGWGICFPAMLIAAIMVLGMMAEGVTKYKTEHERCLKQARTGYEIQQCH